MSRNIEYVEHMSVYYRCSNVTDNRHNPKNTCGVGKMQLGRHCVALEHIVNRLYIYKTKSIRNIIVISIAAGPFFVYR
jgi:hypothetical protein